MKYKSNVSKDIGMTITRNNIRCLARHYKEMINSPQVKLTKLYIDHFCEEFLEAAP